MAGDFNIHHVSWYAEEAISRKAIFNNNKAQATEVVEWTQSWGLKLKNIAGTFTHFQVNGSRPSIVDPTFTKGTASTITEEWICDPGGTSDHAPITTVLNTGHISYLFKRLHRHPNWEIFKKDFRTVELPGN